MKIHKETPNERRLRHAIEEQYGGRATVNREYCVRLPAGTHLVKIPSRGRMLVGAKTKIKIGAGKRTVGQGIQWYRVNAKDQLIDAGLEDLSVTALAKRFDCE